MNSITIGTFIEYTYLTTPILLIVWPTTVSTLTRARFEHWESWNDTLVSPSLGHRVAQGPFEDVRTGGLVDARFQFEVCGRLGGHELQDVVAHRGHFLLADAALLRQRDFVQLRDVRDFESVVVHLVWVLFLDGVDDVQEFLVENEAPVGFFEFFSKLSSLLERCIHVDLIHLS